jgi:hypothetical protein
MPMDYTQCPEFSGPITHQPPPNGTGWERFPEAAGPMCEVRGQDYGTPGMPTIGAIPHLLSPEQRDRERAHAERQYAIREAAERAALAAGLSALEAADAAAKMMDEAREAADKAARR